LDRELRRRRWIVRRKLDGWNNKVIASHLKISERTVIRWWVAYQWHGWEGSGDQVKGAPYSTLNPGWDLNPQLGVGI
jgi:transposase